MKADFQNPLPHAIRAYIKRMQGTLSNESTEPPWCAISYPEIAAAADCSEWQARYWVNELIDAGLFTCVLLRGRRLYSTHLESTQSMASAVVKRAQERRVTECQP